MHYGLKVENVTQLEAARQLGSPFRHAVHTGIVGKHAERGTARVILAAYAGKVAARYVATEGMRIGCYKRQVARHFLFGIGPYYGAYMAGRTGTQVVVVQAAAKEVVAAAPAQLGLCQGTHTVACRAEAERIAAAAQLAVAQTVVDRCLKAERLPVVRIVYAKRCLRVCGNVVVGKDGGETSTRTVGEEREYVAAEVVFVDAAYAGKEAVAAVYLPGESCHGKCKGKVVGVDVGEALQIVHERILVGSDITTERNSAVRLPDTGISALSSRAEASFARLKLVCNSPV